MQQSYWQITGHFTSGFREKEGCSPACRNKIQAPGKIARSVFAKIGVKNEEKGYGAGAHTEKFDVDNDGLYYGLACALNFLINFDRKERDND